MANKVLILGDDNRSFLASVRSLGRLGLEVHAAPEDWSSAVLSSRYIAKKVTLPPHDLSPSAWLDAIERLHAQHHYDFILPCNEMGILPLVRNAERFADTVVGIVNERAFDVFFDKVETRACAQQVGVPVAPGRVFDPAEGPADIISEFGLPVAIKPSRSFVDDNLFSRRSVQLAHTPEALCAALDEMDDWRTYFVEAMFPGSGAGVSVLAKNGRVLQAFQHQRVHEPETGGGSSYRKSVPINDAMLSDVEKLAAATELTGLAMFEFRHNSESGERILLEVNARLWGSVPLAIAAGIDFPALYYQMMVEGTECARISYKTPVYARNLVNDLNSVTDRAVTAVSRPNLGRFKDLFIGLLSYWRMLFGIDKSDTWAKDDPRPHRADLRAFRHDLIGRFYSKVPFLARRAARKALQNLEHTLKALPDNPRIAVLCRGNICRSPLAAKMLEKKAKALRFPLEIVQGGTLPHSGRKSPKNAVTAARAFGIALTRHRSTHVSALHMQDVDLVLHFDPVIEAELRRVERRVDMPLFNLAHLSPTALAQAVITDPVHGDVALFDAVYREIDMALDRFLAMYQRARA